MNRLPSILLVVALLPGAVRASDCAPPKVTEDRLTVVVSDTHFGVGHGAGGDWHPFEDFRWLDDFRKFVAEVDAHGKGATDLVLNGDTFELWQSAEEKDCDRNRNEDQGCTQDEARARIARVLREHAGEMEVLGNFAGQGDNRVILVPGNHDAALLFPEVAGDALKAMKAPAGRACVAREGYWLSRDHQVYAEHGHQIGTDVNGFGERWPTPFWPGDPGYLVRTWGERGVQVFYNQYEDKYEAIDNLNGEGAGVSYGRAAEGLAGTALAAGRFVRFALFSVSWSQFKTSLDSQEEPLWDLKGIKEKGDVFLVESFATDNPLREAAERALAAGDLGLSVKNLEDVEIVELCNRRAALHQSQLDAGKAPTITLCPKGHLGAATQRFLVSRDKKFAKHLQQVNVDLVEAGHLKAGEPFRVFVFSHTHHAEPVFKPLAGQWRPAVLNTGAWQRLATEKDLVAFKTSESLQEKKDVLAAVKLKDLPPCYSFVAVSRDHGTPQASLRYWRQGDDGSWKVRESCDPRSKEGW
jgi:UDP-2,3-diacylglucosamine pyrophosphatase LpxH